MGKNSGSTMVEKLKADGHRMTKTRRALLGLFSSHTKPIGAEFIQKWLAKTGIEVHRATMYRELDFLVGQGVIRQLAIPGATQYELVEMNHHHHVVCVSCKTVKDVELDDDFEQKQKALEKQTKFTITHHSLEFFGLCASCR